MSQQSAPGGGGNARRLAVHASRMKSMAATRCRYVLFRCCCCSFLRPRFSSLLQLLCYWQWHFPCTCPVVRVQFPKPLTTVVTTGSPTEHGSCSCGRPCFLKGQSTFELVCMACCCLICSSHPVPFFPLLLSLDLTKGHGSRMCIRPAGAWA